MPSILGVLTRGIGVLFRRICGWKVDKCLSVVMRVMDDLLGEAVILFSFNHVCIEFI